MIADALGFLDAAATVLGYFSLLVALVIALVVISAPFNARSRSARARRAQAASRPVEYPPLRAVADEWMAPVIPLRRRDGGGRAA